MVGSAGIDSKAHVHLQALVGVCSHAEQQFREINEVIQRFIGLPQAMNMGTETQITHYRNKLDGLAQLGENLRKGLRSQVIQLCSRSSHPPVDLDTSVAYLRFLYLSHPDKNELVGTYSSIALYDSKCLAQHKPHAEDVYIHIAGDQADALSRLGVPLVFLHPRYMEDPPHPALRNKKGHSRRLSWEEWLHEFIRLRQDPSLISPDGSGFSNEFEFIRDKLPHLFLDFLRVLWPYEGCLVAKNAKLRHELAKTRVVCEGGKFCELKKAFLPLPRLRKLSTRFKQNDEPSFIKLRPDPAGTDNTPHRWSFLHELGVDVCSVNDWRLYVRLLEAIADAHPDGHVSSVTGILGLYTAIHLNAQSQRAKELAR
jgi:hypothetical protein